ncbi:MAG: peptidoglycan DD-metalloendopeptidase family protein [Armatimonadetes bacterium]|nr:peptidoglycan DD-metalloendopeptidase family protein [Armatimonadota bacterium]
MTGRTIGVSFGVLLLVGVACLPVVSLNWIYDKLHHTRVQLRIANEKQEDVSRQLHRTVTSLRKTREDLDHLDVKLTQTEIQIRVVRHNLEVVTARFSRHKDVFLRRMKEIYRAGRVDFLSVLANARTFSEFLNRVFYLRLLVNQDVGLLNQLKEDERELRAQRALLDDKRAQISRLKVEVGQKEKQLVSLAGIREDLLSEVEEERRAYTEEIVELEHSSQELERQLQDMIRREQESLRQRHGSTRTFLKSDGSFMWPAGGPLTSNFGWRQHPIFGNLRFHTGLDIGASYGTNIVAASDGIVLYSGWYGGYGQAVVLDHGGGLSTVYAHCSALSTGNSTGPHLHFEMRQNGTAIDPRGKL